MKAANHTIGSAIKKDPGISFKLLDKYLEDKKLMTNLELTQRQQVKTVRMHIILIAKETRIRDFRMHRSIVGT
jgi:hypothetical protein